MSIEQCDNCIRPQVCSLPDESGWCENCNKCSEKDCTNNVVYRVEWTVGKSREHCLYRDVCEEHANDEYTPGYDCACSYTATHKIKIPFVYKIKDTA